MRDASGWRKSAAHVQQYAGGWAITLGQTRKVTVTTLDLNGLKGALGFTVTFRKWGNTRKGDVNALLTANAKGRVPTAEDGGEAKRSRLKLSKELIVAEEYEAIKSFLAAEGLWVTRQTVPTFFKEGFYLTNQSGIEPIEKRMKEAQVKLASLVDDLIKVYPECIAAAQDELKEQFNPFDYPMSQDLRRKFGIAWNWISFTVPEGLPPELKAIEQAKMEEQFADAGEQITSALRVSFQKLIAHATEKLTVAPGEKQKKFYDSSVDNINEFIGAFNQRNLMNDVELAKLVAQAKDILTGADKDVLRKDLNIRDAFGQKFAAVNTALSSLVTTKSTRQFDLD